MRDKSIDILKGIAILLMIVGHLKGIPTIVHSFIYSFHMPLFVFVSGYFYKRKPLMFSVTRDMKQIVLPYIICCVFYIIRCICFGDFEWTQQTILASLFAQIGPGETFFSTPISGIGMLWFLMALFWCRFLFNLMSHFIRDVYLLFVTCITLTIAAIYLQQCFPLIPLCFVPGMGMLVFYLIGFLVRTYSDWFTRKKVAYLSVIPILIWVWCIFKSSVVVGACSYGCLPLDIIGSIGGTIVFLFISRFIENYKISDFFAWCGNYSLTLFSFSFLEDTYALVYYTPLKDFGLLTALFHLFIPIVCTYVFIKIQSKLVLIIK